MQKFLSFVLLLIGFSTVSNAQELFLKREGLDLGNDRYIKMKNSPYLFEKFQEVRLYDKFGKKIENIKVNYNGYTGELETELDGKILALDGFSYPRFEVYGTHDIYVNAFLNNGTYVKLIFDGEKTRYFTQFISTLDDKGKKFNGEQVAYLIKDGRTIKMTKEIDLFKAINSPALNEYADKNKLGTANEAKITALLLQYESY